MSDTRTLNTSRVEYAEIFRCDYPPKSSQFVRPSSRHQNSQFVSRPEGIDRPALQRLQQPFALGNPMLTIVDRGMVRGQIFRK